MPTPSPTADSCPETGGSLLDALNPPFFDWFLSHGILPALARRPDLLQELAGLLEPYLQAAAHPDDQPPPKPSPVTFDFLREEFDQMAASRIIGRPRLSAKGAPDVERRELELVIAGGEPRIFDVSTDVPEIGIPKGAPFTLRLRETDRDGNVGDWSDPVDLMARDVFAPPKPGPLSFEALREEFDPDEPGGTAPADETGVPAPGTGGPAPDAGAGGTGPAPDAGTGGELGGPPVTVDVPPPGDEDLEPGGTTADPADGGTAAP